MCRSTRLACGLAYPAAAGARRRWGGQHGPATPRHAEVSAARLRAGYSSGLLLLLLLLLLLGRDVA